MQVGAGEKREREGRKKMKGLFFFNKLFIIIIILSFIIIGNAAKCPLFC
jgi:hypothetical protein